MIDQKQAKDPKLDYLRERYAFDDWSDPGTPAESLFVWQFARSRSRHDLPGYELQRSEEIEPDQGQPPSSRAMWRSESDPEAVLELLTSEFPDRSSARVGLLSTLGQFQGFLERRELGELAFAPAGDGAVTFLVANLLVIVRTVDGLPTPVTSPAQSVEREISARPERGGPVAPEIHELTTGQPRPDGTIPIEVKAADPLGRPLWFKVFGHGGEAVDRNGELAFRPYGSQSWDLTFFAISESGSSAERTLSAS